MPIYDYRCPDCGNTFEARQQFDDPPHLKCLDCGAQAHRQFGVPHVRFKGTGFYSTDNRKET